jgi:chaperonin GroES
VNLKPQDNRVVLKLEEMELRTAGGLVLPGTMQDKTQRGEVLAIGPGKLSSLGDRLEMEVSVGDTVYINKAVGTKVTIEKEEFLIVFENDVLAVVE